MEVRLKHVLNLLDFCKTIPRLKDFAKIGDLKFLEDFSELILFVIRALVIILNALELAAL